MMLKAKRTPVENHPVIKRIVQYRNVGHKVNLNVGPLKSISKPQGLCSLNYLYFEGPFSVEIKLQG